jgi:hypothetical protein
VLIAKPVDYVSCVRRNGLKATNVRPLFSFHAVQELWNMLSPEINESEVEFGDPAVNSKVSSY